MDLEAKGADLETLLLTFDFLLDFDCFMNIKLHSFLSFFVVLLLTGMFSSSIKLKVAEGRSIIMEGMNSAASGFRTVCVVLL